MIKYIFIIFFIPSIVFAEIENARDLMVENQLRPNKITETTILDLFRNTKKEDFLSEELKKISYSDLDINLDTNRGYLKNLHIAQLIHNSLIFFV